MDPSPSQARVLASHCGAARVAYNWGLAQVKANLDQREAERSYGIPVDQLTPALSWSFMSLRKAWNQAKATVAPWWAENSKEAYGNGLVDLSRALANWQGSKKGARRGPRMGFPRFKTKRGATKSCRFGTGVIRLEEDRRHVTLPVIGTMRTHESTAKLHRRIVAGSARILSATVRQRCGRWQVSFQVEIHRGSRAASHPDAAVGVDLGIKTLAVMADSTGGIRVVLNPRYLDASLVALRRANRQMARRRGPVVRDPVTGKKELRQASRGWDEARARVAEVHRRVACQRADAHHKLTTSLVSEYGTIVLEDLNVGGMLGNRTLARHIADAGFGRVRRQLEYKTAWNGRSLIVADRWFPSSKTCSSCGTVKTKLSLSEREYACESCGLVIDRDVNAAVNLVALAAGHPGPGVAGPTPGRHLSSGNARGADCKTGLVPAGGAEAGTALPDRWRKTRTVVREDSSPSAASTW